MNRPGHLSTSILGALLALTAVPTAFGESGADVHFGDPWQGYRASDMEYRDAAPDPYRDEAVSFFYDDLAPYGDWEYLDDLGWVWQPRGVSRDWQPYTDGRWVWTDDGWTWISDWEWGWAPFHYGRWTYYDTDWVWVPGLEWAPAWVTWRTGDGVIGWAPLPPRLPRYREVLVEPYWAERAIVLPPAAYCFVDLRMFLEPRIHHYIVPRYRNVTLVHVTQNITRYTFVENRVVNRGPDVREVERFSHQPVKHYRIADYDRPVKRGEHFKDNEVVMFRPSPKGEPGQRHRDPLRSRSRESAGRENGRGFATVRPDNEGEVRPDSKAAPRYREGRPPDQAFREKPRDDFEPRDRRIPKDYTAPPEGRGGAYPTEPGRREATRENAPFPPGTVSGRGTGNHQENVRGRANQERSLPAPAWEAHTKRGERPFSPDEARAPEPPTVRYPPPTARESAVPTPPMPRYPGPEFSRPQPSPDRDAKPDEARQPVRGVPAAPPPEVRERQPPHDEQRSPPQPRGGGWREVPRESFKDPERRDRRPQPESNPAAYTGRADRRAPEAPPMQQSRQQPTGRPEPTQQGGPPARTREGKAGEYEKQKHGQRSDDDKN